MNIEAIGTKLREAVRAARASGVVVSPFMLGHRKAGRCCAVGALVLDDPLSVNRYAVAAKRLGLFDRTESHAIAMGFDHPDDDHYLHLELVKLGAQLRREVDGGLL